MAKENISKIKGKPTIQENIFANDTLDKGMISKIYRAHMTQNQEDKQSNQNMAKGPEQKLLQGGHTEGPETYERMLNITRQQRHAN